MNWLDDVFWKSAYMELLEIQSRVDVVFVPQDLVGLSGKYYPYQYSYSFDANHRLAVMLHKDMIHKVHPKLLNMGIYYENPVFVILSNLDIEPSLSIRLRIPKIRQQIEQKKDAGQSKPWRVYQGSDSSKRVLIVGASGLGNTGDNLIAHAISKVLRDVFGDVTILCSSFEVSEADIRSADLVVIGGGGIVYGVEHQSDARQNLANYFSLPYLCESLGVPCVVTSVGLQDEYTHLHDSATNNFMKGALTSCASVSCRDSITLEYLKNFVESDKLLLAPDVAFYLGLDVYRCRANLEESRSICFVGEVFSVIHNFVEKVFSDRAWVRSTFNGLGFTFAVMSNDDIYHAQRFAKLMQDMDLIDFSVVDTRDWSADRLIQFFSEQRTVLSTRFHGLIFSILADTPVVNVSDSRNIKKQTLVKEYFPDMIIINSKTDLLDVRAVLENVCNNPLIYKMPEEHVNSVLMAVSKYREQFSKLSGHLENRRDQPEQRRTER